MLPTKTIAIRIEVAQKLDRAKRPGETYSDVIERYIGDKPKLLEVVKFLREHPLIGKDTLTPRLRKIRRDSNKSNR